MQLHSLDGGAGWEALEGGDRGSYCLQLAVNLVQVRLSWAQGN